MITLPYILIALAIVGFIIASVLEYQAAREAELGPHPDTIATVCMECGCHLGGPTPKRARFVSHGICRPCKEKWQSELLTHVSSFKLPPRPSYQSHTSHPSHTLTP